MRLILALVPVLGLAGIAAAHAQDGYASGYSLQTPRSQAAQMQSMLGATDRRSQHQEQVAKVRGDAGYLGGFSLGQPLSASVQQGYGSSYGYGDQGTVINEFEGPVVIGNGNVVQQQTAISSGPIAQQQVAGSGGGATNVIGRGGRIAQSAPNVVQSPKLTQTHSVRRPPSPPQMP